jgi:spore germination protein GerM
VTVYFMNDDATGLIKTVLAGPNTPASLSVLAAATPPSGAIAPFPRGTEVIGVSLKDDEARVDLTNAFVTGYPSGGAAAELAVLAPLIYTATEVPGITHVRFTVNGEAPVLPGSQFDWAAPFSRDDVPDLPVSAQ